MAASAVGRQPAVWADPRCRPGEPSLVMLKEGVLHLLVVPPAELPAAVAALRAGRPWAAVGTQVPLRALAHVEGEAGGDRLTIAYHAASPVVEMWAVRLPDPQACDELIGALAAQLGPAWRVEGPWPRRWALPKGPLIAAVFVVGWTWVWYCDARQPPSQTDGPEYEALLWAARWLGPAWSAAVAGAVTVAFAAAVFLAGFRPAARVVLRPVATGRSQGAEPPTPLRPRRRPGFWRSLPRAWRPRRGGGGSPGR